jgi:cytosol alanyl aminopeptidase
MINAHPGNPRPQHRQHARWIVCIAAAATLTACGSSKSNVKTTDMPAANDGQGRFIEGPGLQPAQPPLRLPKNFIPTDYRLALRIDPTQAGFSGTVEVTGRAAEPTSQVWLHAENLNVDKDAKITVAGSGGSVTGIASPIGKDLLSIRLPKAVQGIATIQLTFKGKYEDKETIGAFKQLVGTDPYVFSQMEATYARRVFPCVDEPGLKVPWNITISAPKPFSVVSNSLPISTKPDADGTWLTTTFAQTKPLPTYLVAFAVGAFEFVDAGKTSSGAPIRIVTAKGKAANASYAAQTSKRVVEILEQWFGIPYPYDKLDMVSIPITVGFGAMENAGMITYTESSIMLPENPSWRQRHRWIGLAGHEIAHQWFGNLVTMQWWDDIWLNEGFASWMEAKVLTAFEPNWHDEVDIELGRQEALGADSLVSARQVRQPITETGDISNAFDSITYQKGSALLTMFEQWLGPAVFQKGVRSYLEKHAFGNAASTDFIASMSAAAGRDISATFNSFLDQPGVPTVAITLNCDAKPTVAIEQKRFVPSGSVAPAGNPLWHFPVCITIFPGKSQCFEVSKPTENFELSDNTSKPGNCPWIIGNSKAAGYYRETLSQAQVQDRAKRAWPQMDQLEKIAFFSDVQQAVDDGKLTLQTGLDLLPLMAKEPGRRAIDQVVGTIGGLRGPATDAQRTKLDAWTVKLLGDGARKLGWQPSSTDDLDTESSRSALVATVARAGDPGLRKQAVDAMKDWRKLPESIRGRMMSIAAMTDKSVFAMFLQQVVTEPERRIRSEMLRAIGSTTTIEQQNQALALLFNPKLDPRETSQLLFSYSNEAQRDNNEKFFLSRFDELMKLLPNESTTSSAAEYVYVLTSVCKAERRAEVATTADRLFGKMTGAKMTISQALEGMDQCIARRAVFVPQLQAWLARM